jgi:hypothetical protein
MEHGGGRELTAQDYGNNTLEDMHLHRPSENHEGAAHMSEVQNVNRHRRISP